MPDKTLQTISASQAPMLYNGGVSPYGSRWHLYRHFAHGDVIDTKDPHSRMFWGKYLQSGLIRACGENLGLEVVENVEDVYVRGEGDFARLGCTRDAEIYAPGDGPGALEVKMCFDYPTWMEKWDGGKAPPRHIEIQTQQQMAVGIGGVPFTWGVIAVWAFGSEMKFFHRKPDAEMWGSLCRESGTFFADVAAKNEPPLDGLPIEMDLLNRVYPVVLKKEIDFVATLGADEARKLAQDIALMKWHGAERLGHEKGEKGIKARIMALMKDAETGYFGNGVTVKLTQQYRNGYSVEPTSFKTMNAYVPRDAADALAPFVNKVLPI